MKRKSRYTERPRLKLPSNINSKEIKERLERHDGIVDALKAKRVPLHELAELITGCCNDKVSLLPDQNALRANLKRNIRAIRNRLRLVIGDIEKTVEPALRWEIIRWDPATPRAYKVVRQEVGDFKDLSRRLSSLWKSLAEVGSALKIEPIEKTHELETIRLKHLAESMGRLFRKHKTRLPVVLTSDIINAALGINTSSTLYQNRSRARAVGRVAAEEMKKTLDWKIFEVGWRSFVNISRKKTLPKSHR